MRRAAKVDKNQPEIVAALRKAGCSVQPLHGVGEGCPDLLVAKMNQNWLMEVKCEDGNNNAKNRDLAKCLTPDQHKFHFLWQGPIDVVWTPEEAIEAVQRRIGEQA